MHVVNRGRLHCALRFEYVEPFSANIIPEAYIKTEGSHESMAKDIADFVCYDDQDWLIRNASPQTQSNIVWQ